MTEAPANRPTEDPADHAPFFLDGSPLTLEALDHAWGRPVRIDVADDIWDRIDTSAATVKRIAASPVAAYGINTGFGLLCTKRISPEQVEMLQTNLILSHAVGVGAHAADEIVRWMILFKIHALTHGVSGVTRATIDCLRRMVNADLLPVVPIQGSLGASGDLAPLAHIVLAMLGRGSVRVNGEVQPASEALAHARIDPVVLGPKEGLGLINGTQFMSAYGAALVVHARRLLKQTDVIGCMSLEGFSGSLKPFDDRLHRLRPHPGALQVAENVRRMMADSEVLAAHAACDRVQDPYSIRCIPQVHGASRDAVSHVAGVVETEINAVTDNPLILGDGEVVSGGSFHGQPLALALDYLAIALAELASISERRIYLLLSGEAGLPVLLMQDTGLNSGFMVPQYTAAALVSENKGLCMPASVDSIPTSLGQEDHVSMGARAAVKCWQVLENTQTVLAIEQICAAQALDYRAPLKAGIGPRVARDEIRKVVRHAEQDRVFGEDITSSLELVRSNRIVEAVESEVGTLH